MLARWLLLMACVAVTTSETGTEPGTNLSRHVTKGGVPETTESYVDTEDEDMHPACLESVNNKLIGLRMQQLGDKFYYFSDPATERLDWSEARDFCVSRGLQLASIETQREASLITVHTKDIDIASGGSHFWLGASDHSGRWAWSTGSDVTFSAWYEGRPDSRSKMPRCLALYVCDVQNNWFDLSCSDRRRYLCELDEKCRPRIVYFKE